MIGHAELLEMLRYDPGTGEFIWLVDYGKFKVGEVAGYQSFPLKFQGRTGYRLPYWKIQINGKVYFRGKLAWFYVTGEWPEDEMDHRDTDSLNDRWVNLRPATRQQNNANRRIFKNNKTGQKGVHFRADVGKFRAMISVDGKNRSLGYFEKFEEAAAVYAQHAKIEFGEFARIV